MPLVGDPLFDFTVQVVVDGQTRDRCERFGMGDAPEAIELACDLGHPVMLHDRPFHCVASSGGS